ncbi:uncharacterized protein LOC141605369 [Silene latifolia]|uniref:uncharacterized protein LOC141605369 n=1 Tax=Silene latifolia TaxID=37657 RepID=UPI003D776D58
MDSCEHPGETSCASLAGEVEVPVGVRDGNAIVGCSDRVEVGLETGNVVEGSGLGERLQELVVEPLSSLDISSQASQSGKGSDFQSSIENDGYLKNDVRTLEGDDGDFTVASVRNSEEIGGRADLATGCVDDATERGNELGIECGLSRMCFDEIECDDKIEIGQCESDSGYQEPSKTNHDGLVYDASAMSLIMPDKSGPEIVVAACSVDHVVESFNHENNDVAGSARNDDCENELKCLNSFLSLRRSSRSRKTVQKVQREKNAIKVSKRSSKITLSQTIDLFSEATRKKRSSLSRSICSSGWGLSGSFAKYFERSMEASAKQVLEEGKPEMKAGRRSRKKNSSKVAPSSHLAEERPTLPCRPIRLKVTFGKKEERNDFSGVQPRIDDNISVSVSVSNNENPSGNAMDNPSPKEMCTIMQCSSSTSKVPLRGINLEMCSMSEKSSHSDSFERVESEKPGSSHTGKFLDPGTSPDSEVIDSSVGPISLLNNFEKNIDGSFSVPLSLICPASSQSSKNKKKKKSPQKADKSKKDMQLQKCNDNVCTDGTNVPSENPLNTTSGSGSELISMELLSATDEGFQKAPSLVNGVDCNLSLRLIGIESVDSGKLTHLLTPETPQKRNSKGSKMKSKSKKQPKISNVKSNQKEPSGKRKGNKKLASKPEVIETDLVDEAPQDRDQPGAGNLELVTVANTDCSSTLVPQTLSCLPLPPTGVVEQTLPPRVAWVCCDECEKWRCIPAKLADVIEETNGKWTCKDNQDQAFADCSIPQEKSNAAINAELQISDEEDGRNRHLGYKGSGDRPPGDPQQSTWTLIKSNLFLHRRRKTQSMDEVMVCHCKPPADGTLGCGNQCLNRMLNIECVHGTCPCGDLCSNQQFQQRSYANLSWFRCGRKGYGLQVLEDISEGKFLIEYVGEVLDLQSYEARQKDYALKGHKHFYFMTLNGNEVIDACSKGNLGRFVNHSCDPNCRTEKWVVNGEICVGLFALRNIRKDEELTFDYNYVRVFGAAAKKCYCGALKCRGYIGGDPSNSEVVVQGDSDDEFPEPIAVDENGELDHSLEKNMLDRFSSQDVEHMLEGDMLHEKSSANVIPDVIMVKAIEECSNDVISKSTNLMALAAGDEVCESLDILAVEANKETNEPIASPTTSKLDLLPIECSKSPLGSVDSNDKMSIIVVGEVERPLSKARPRMKISRPAKSTKNRKSSSITCDEKPLMTAQPLRSQIVPYKPKKLLEGSVNGHLEGVEGKLNELLDTDGGICKKKDASKGYLKLLLLTAASGDSGNGGAIQSNRELSMILDAFLKTKSRGVLLDIISKNGLQMLHNMMKLYRKDFKKTPILRKLLKVLEFLAEKEILSVERIIGDSVRPGVESFRESILNLTEHEDKKVHQIARNFRDRWIPRPLRNKYNVMDNVDRKREREFSRNSNCNKFPGTYNQRREQGTRMPETNENMKQSPPVNSSCDTRSPEAFSPQLINFQAIMTRPRKRKSRWDQPADPKLPKRRKEQGINPFSPDKIKASPKPEASKEGCSTTDDPMGNSEDDAPPGFSCLQNDEVSPPGFSSSIPAQNSRSLEPVVSLGLLQERFNPGIPVAYGIPFSVLQHFGCHESGTAESWEIAPSFPFKPFPPLPPYPCDKNARLKPCPSEGDAQACPGLPSTSGPSLPHAPNSGPTSQNMSHHGRGSWNGPGRRFHKQKNQRPPWFRNLDGRSFKGPHPRNRGFDRNLESIVCGQNGQHLGDVNQSLDCAGDFY